MPLLEWLLDRLALVAAVLAFVTILACVLAAWRHGRVGWAAAVRSAVRDVAPVAALAPVIALAFAPGTARSEAQTGINLLPFRDLIAAAVAGGGGAAAGLDILANVVVFVPVGAATALRFPRAPLALVAVAMAGVSVAIEVGQAFLVAGRASDATDVLTNVCGALLGYLIWRDAGSRDRGGAEDA